MAGPLSKDGSIHVTDEKFNSASHLAGAIAALAGWVVLITEAAVQHDPWKIVSFAIYGLGLFLLMLFSALHHGVNGSPRTDQVLKLLDYNAIFLVIAGTLTPLVLVLLRTPLAWALWGVCWFLAVVGMALKSSRPQLPKWVTNVLFVGMGCMALPLLQSLWPRLGALGLGLLVGGGVCYLAGALVYAVEQPNPWPGRFGFHEIWHLCVLGGAACHYLLMLWFVLPA